MQKDAKSTDGPAGDYGSYMKQYAGDSSKYMNMGGSASYAGDYKKQYASKYFRPVGESSPQVDRVKQHSGDDSKLMDRGNSLTSSSLGGANEGASPKGLQGGEAASGDTKKKVTVDASSEKATAEDMIAVLDETLPETAKRPAAEQAVGVKSSVAAEKHVTEGKAETEDQPAPIAGDILSQPSAEMAKQAGSKQLLLLVWAMMALAAFLGYNLVRVIQRRWKLPPTRSCSPQYSACK